MDFITWLIFDVVIEGLSKLADKLRRERPKDAQNGTAAEWIVLVLFIAAIVGGIVFDILCAQEEGDSLTAYVWIFVLVITALAVLLMMLRRGIRWMKKRRQENQEWL